MSSSEDLGHFVLLRDAALSSCVDRIDIAPQPMALCTYRVWVVWVFLPGHAMNNWSCVTSHVRTAVTGFVEPSSSCSPCLVVSELWLRAVKHHAGQKRRFVVQGLGHFGLFRGATMFPLLCSHMFAPLVTLNIAGDVLSPSTETRHEHLEWVTCLLR